ncbi:MAG: AAA family ATPase [Treponema sp.]|nr:AAA family ATPase [Treponema sp.]
MKKSLIFIFTPADIYIILGINTKKSHYQEVFMLIRFNVKNFLSFNEKLDIKTQEKRSQEFAMLSGSTRGKKDHIVEINDQNILKFAAIFGANAAGKSNVIKTLEFIQKTVRSGNIPTGATENYCKIYSANKDKVSYFELEILIDNQNYSYGFEYELNKGILHSEWLVNLRKDKEIVLFEKQNKSSNYHFDGILKKLEVLQVYADGLEGSNSLLLSTLNKNTTGLYKKYPDAVIIQKIFDWIVNKLSINFPDNPLPTDAAFLLDEDNFLRFSNLLNSFGTGINKLKKAPIDAKKLIEQLPSFIRNEILKGIDLMNKTLAINSDIKSKKSEMGAIIRNNEDIFLLHITPNSTVEAYSILFEHNFFDQSVDFKISNESDGTARLFELIQLLLDKNDKTFVIDELDRRLHPCLTYQFVKTYLQICKNRNIQLIVTTHESRLLDFDLLRRDEIWFVNKDKNGESDLYSLEEYNERFDRKIDKAYLEGRYKGVPIFTTVYPVEDDL